MNADPNGEKFFDWLRINLPEITAADCQPFVHNFLGIVTVDMRSVAGAIAGYLALLDATPDEMMSTEDTREVIKRAIQLSSELNSFILGFMLYWKYLADKDSESSQ